MLEWQDISEQDYIIIQYLNTITDVDRDVVFTLYQPIIGAKAASVYQFLISHAQHQVRMTHQDMLLMLQFNVQEFFQSRARLEAIGLLTTYRTDNDNLDKYIYDVHAPVTPHDFFNDPVYCGLLTEQVGETYFQTLRKKFIIEPLSISEYHNISQSFIKVFGQQINVRTNDVSIIGNERSRVQIEEKSFDWEFFSQLILGTYVTTEQLTPQVKQAILTINQLYHVTPMDMREYILQAHSIADNTINVDKLYAIARENKPQSNQSTSTKQAEHQDVAEHEKYPQRVQRIIEQCYQAKPVDFLTRLKQDKSRRNLKGLRFQVEDAEIKVLEMLVREVQLTEAVVNVLVYYILGVLNHATLTQAYAKRVANDWVAQEISTPEQAMDYLKVRSEKREKTANQKHNQRQTVKQIKLTEQEKKAMHDVDIPVDAEEWNKMFS